MSRQVAALLAFATQGAGGDDENRLRTLLRDTPAEFFAFDHKAKKASFLELLRQARSGRFSGLVMEGSGVAGGLACLLAKWLIGCPYVVSSGDAIEPFLSARMPWAWPIFWAYEKLLYQNCGGFIGWTPYLVGRALTMGAPRGMTAAGWAPFQYETAELSETRRKIRSELGIPQDEIVFGIVGSLAWSKRWAYCYGHELVQAAVTTGGEGAYVLVVGDGEGRAILEKLAGPLLRKKIFLPGRVRRDQVPGYLAAMDVGSLPQSVDGVGSFRYTTKVSEYLSQRLPFVTNQIPAAYDLDCGGMWRLGGKSPWDSEFVRQLGKLMMTVTREEILLRRSAIPEKLMEFDRDAQVGRVTAFLRDLSLSGE